MFFKTAHEGRRYRNIYFLFQILIATVNHSGSITSHGEPRRRLVGTGLTKHLFVLLKASSDLVSFCTFYLVNVLHKTRSKNKVTIFELNFWVKPLASSVNCFRPSQMFAFITWISLQFCTQNPRLLLEWNIRINALFLGLLLHLTKLVFHALHSFVTKIFDSGPEGFVEEIVQFHVSIKLSWKKEESNSN